MKYLGWRHFRQILSEGIVIWWLPLLAFVLVFVPGKPLFVGLFVFSLSVILCISFLLSPRLRDFWCKPIQEDLLLLSQHRLKSSFEEIYSSQGIDIIWRDDRPRILGPVQAIDALACLFCKINNTENGASREGAVIASYSAVKDVHNKHKSRWSATDYFVEGTNEQVIAEIYAMGLVPDDNTPKETLKWSLEQSAKQRNESAAASDRV